MQKHISRGITIISPTECKYKRATWSDCDPVSNKKVMVKTLKRGDPASCNQTLTEEKECKRKSKRNVGMADSWPLTQGGAVLLINHFSIWRHVLKIIKMTTPYITLCYWRIMSWCRLWQRYVFYWNNVTFWGDKILFKIVKWWTESYTYGHCMKFMKLTEGSFYKFHMKWPHV